MFLAMMTRKVKGDGHQIWRIKVTKSGGWVKGDGHQI